MGHLAARAFARFPSDVAMIDAHASITYESLGSMVGTAMDRLRAVGVVRGGGVAQLAGNSAQAWAVQCATYCLGARFVGLHARGSVQDQRFMLTDSRVESLVVDDLKHPGKLGELSSGVSSLRHAVNLSSIFDGAPQRLAVTEDEIQATMPDMARLAYTGGTTGRPKGVMLPHRSLVTNTLMTMAELPWPRRNRFISGAPITHAAGSYILPVLLRGGTVVLLDHFTADGFVEAVERYRCTSAHMVPTMMYDLLDRLDGDPSPVSTLEMVRYGASPISAARLEQAIDVLGGERLVQGYGQTEAPNTLCLLGPQDHVLGAPQLASVGTPYAGNEIAILGEQNERVPIGGTGEICVRSPLVMDGYWERPEETADALAGGWLHTGDLGRQDDRGFVYIVGRKKDMIITGGFNVYPKEVEDALSRHPAVAAAAVIGVPDPRWGEAVVAVIVPRPGIEVSTQELIDFVKAEKGSIAAPKRVEFRDGLPLTAVGKPDKRQLQESLSSTS
jgi:fatty-acyl-CoA synthase